MSATEDADERRARAQAVDEEYNKLGEFMVDRRRIVVLDDDYQRSGGSGIVRRAKLHHSALLPAWLASHRYGPPQLVAVKQIKISVMDSMMDLKQAFTKETLVWSQLTGHPGIAKFLGFHADFERGEAWLLSPWEPNGNISEFIRSHNLEIPEKLSFVYDTIQALTFLHQLNPPVCHGDIKSANVLVSAHYKAVLCDFGLARLHEDSGFEKLETSGGFRGSIRWCSPEILNGAPRAPPGDVYSWAWLVWEIMTGELPYGRSTMDFVIMQQILESPLPPVDGKLRLRDCLQVWELLMRCWNSDPLQRPTARMCRTTINYTPHCTPSPENADHQTRSAALLENLGDLESWKGNSEKSAAYFDEAMSLYEEEDDLEGITSVLLKQAVAAHRISDYTKLRDVASTALEHCRTLNDPLGIAEASYYLGHAVHMLGQPDGAMLILLVSLEICRAHGDEVGAVQCLERIAVIQTAKGRHQEALSTLDEALAIAVRAGDRMGLANALHAVGHTFSQMSDFFNAAEAISGAITINRNIGCEGELSTALRSLGCLRMQLGELREAEELLQESVSIARRIGSPYKLARSLEELGNCFFTQPDLQKAVVAMEEAYRLWHELSRPTQAMWAAFAVGELKRMQRKWDGALAWDDQAIAVARNQKEQPGLASLLVHKGRILVELQRYDAAALHFEAAIASCRENGCTWVGEREVLCAIPMTSMKWERRMPLFCDVRKLLRRVPQITTSSIRLPIPVRQREP